MARISMSRPQSAARALGSGTIVTVDADLIEVTGVRVLGHYRLRLTFSDGRVGDVDVSDVKNMGNLYEPLRSPQYFERVRVDHDLGTIVWPNGLDLAPERLYREAQPVTAEATGHVGTNAAVVLVHAILAGISGLLRVMLRAIDHLEHATDPRSGVGA